MQYSENNTALPVWIIPSLGALGYCLMMQPFNQHGTSELVMATALILIGMSAYLFRKVLMPRDEREQYLHLVSLRKSLVITCLVWLPVSLLLSASLATTWALMAIIWAIHMTWYLISRR